MKPTLSTEICMRDLRCSYYHALGPKPMDPLGFLFTLVLRLGVASSFWCCSLLEAVDSADHWGGLSCGRYVAGCTEYPLGISGTLFTSFGAVWETSAGLPADGT